MALRRTDICMDVGESLNPAIDVGQVRSRTCISLPRDSCWICIDLLVRLLAQVEGGFIQGMGWVALEELKWGDPSHQWIRPGHLFTRGPGAYKARYPNYSSPEAWADSGSV
jgi:xanthine dehydrogenase/oxidase